MPIAPSRISCFCFNIVDIDIIVNINVFDEKFERLVMSGNRFYEISDVKQKRCLNEVSLAFVVNNE